MLNYGRVKHIILIAVLLLVVAGCGGGPAARRAPEPGPMQNDANMDREAHMTAEEAVRISEGEKGVERAHAVVHDNATLLVGIVPEANISEEEKKRLENTLEQKIRDEVEGVNRVMVTTEKQHADRIRDIERDVRGGKPLTDLRNDTRDLFDRLTDMRR